MFNGYYLMTETSSVLNNEHVDTPPGLSTYTKSFLPPKSEAKYNLC